MVIFSSLAAAFVATATTVSGEQLIHVPIFSYRDSVVTGQIVIGQGIKKQALELELPLTSGDFWVFGPESKQSVDAVSTFSHKYYQQTSSFEDNYVDGFFGKSLGNGDEISGTKGYESVGFDMSKSEYYKRIPIGIVNQFTKMDGGATKSDLIFDGSFGLWPVDETSPMYRLMYGGTVSMGVGTNRVLEKKIFSLMYPTLGGGTTAAASGALVLGGYDSKHIAGKLGKYVKLEVKLIPGNAKKNGQKSGVTRNKNAPPSGLTPILTVPVQKLVVGKRGKLKDNNGGAIQKVILDNEVPGVLLPEAALTQVMALWGVKLTTPLPAIQEEDENTVQRRKGKKRGAWETPLPAVPEGGAREEKGIILAAGNLGSSSSSTPTEKSHNKAADLPLLERGYFVLCKQLKSMRSIRFSIGGKTCSLPPARFFARLEENQDWCTPIHVGALPSSLKQESAMVLGHIFFERYVTVFDFEDPTQIMFGLGSRLLKKKQRGGGGGGGRLFTSGIVGGHFGNSTAPIYAVEI